MVPAGRRTIDRTVRIILRGIATGTVTAAGRTTIAYPALSAAIRDTIAGTNVTVLIPVTSAVPAIHAKGITGCR